MAGRSGNRCGDAAPHGAYPCQGDDRWCAIAVFSENEWRAFCGVLGNPEWTEKAEFATLSDRKKNEAELDRLTAEWTMKHTAAEVMRLMQAAGVAAGLVSRPEQLLDDPQLKHRNHFWYLNHSELGSYPHLGESFQLSQTPVAGRLPAPILGEHTISARAG